MSKRKAKPQTHRETDKAKPKADVRVPAAEAPLTQPVKKISRVGLLLTCIGVFLLVFLVFLPTVKNDFINYDDWDYVTQNPHVSGGLTAKGVAWAFTTGYAANWHPLTWISHMADCQFYGLKPWGHHLTSIIFHALNTMLLFVVLRRMTGAYWRSLLVALLFGLHPLRVESVAWVAERKDVLCTFFWMLTMWMYVLYVEKSRVQGAKFKVYYCLAFLFFACGLMCKPMLVTLPFVLLLLDFWPLKRFGGWRSAAADKIPEKSLARLLVEKVPFFFLTVSSVVITYLVQQRGGTMDLAAGIPLLARWENVLVSYARYLGKLLWPENLAIFYPFPASWPVAFVIFSALLLVFLSALAWRQRRRRPYYSIGWLWFLGTLVPVIGLIQVGVQSMADRYTYLPSIGILIFIVWGLAELAGKWRARILLPGAAVGALLACIVITEKQIPYWQDLETLWRRALAATTGNYLAHNNLGAFLSNKGKLDEALEHIREAVRLRPDYARAHYNLGLALVRKGQLEEAIPHYRDAVRFDPKYFDAHNNLGVALYYKGQLDEAIAEWREALKISPGNAAILENIETAESDKAAGLRKPPAKTEDQRPP